MDKDTMIGELVRLVGRENVLSSAMHFKLYEYDASLIRSKPDCIVLPTSTEQVSKVVKFTHENKIPVIARGSGTNLSGGSVTVQGGIAVVLTKMNQILDMDFENLRVAVQPGVITLDLKNVLAKHGYLYQPDPASEKVTTIGGNFGENAGGPHCLKYGVTSNHVLGAEVVLSDGQVVRWAGRPWTIPVSTSWGSWGLPRERWASSPRRSSGLCRRRRRSRRCSASTTPLKREAIQ